MVQALEKIRDICAFALGMNNQNQAMLLTHDNIPDGPKMKHCKPRRRGGMSGYLLGVNSYFPSNSSAFSPTPSASMGHNGSPIQPHGSPERDVEPLATPLSRDSLLPDLHDNLQLEMIEIDTITGSREASPSPADPCMLDLPCDPPGNQDSDIMLSGVKTSFSPEDDAQIQTGSAADDSEPGVRQENRESGNEVLPPVPEPPTLKPYPQNSEQPDHGDTTTLNGTSFPYEDDPSTSEVPKPHPDVSTLPPDAIEEARDANGLDTKPTPKPLGLEPQESENLTSLDPTSHGMEDIKPSSHLAEKDIPEPSPTHQDCSGQPVSGETMKADGLDVDILEGSRGKRKGPTTDNVDTASSGVTVSSPRPDNSHDYGKSPFKSSPEGESQVGETDPVAAKDNVQRKYKRLRRSVQKPR